MGSTSTVKTTFLLLSDTHGKDLVIPNVTVDVAIHCGDLTDESKLEEFRTSLALLMSIDAPLKLVTAGNHDWSLDESAYKRLTAEALTNPDIGPELVKEEYGDVGEARQLFMDAQDGITFLDEGTHTFRLHNGAALTVYASPFTPSPEATMGFQYKLDTEHEFDISPKVNVAITHGPPQGVLDRTASNKRAGSEELFAAIAKARPLLHCFGHIHESWGAKLVTWRGKETTASTSSTPSHFTEIDNGASNLIDSAANYKPKKFDREEDIKDRKKRREQLFRDGFRSTGSCSPASGQQTLFVNAALEIAPEDEDAREMVPWIVELDLPSA